MNYLLNLPY